MTLYHQELSVCLICGYLQSFRNYPPFVMCLLLQQQLPGNSRPMKLFRRILWVPPEAVFASAKCTLDTREGGLNMYKNDSYLFSVTLSSTGPFNPANIHLSINNQYHMSFSERTCKSLYPSMGWAHHFLLKYQFSVYLLGEGKPVNIEVIWVSEMT